MRRAAPIVLALVVLGGCATRTARPEVARPWPIRHEERSGTWSDGTPWRAQVAWVDLRDPRVSFHVPAPPPPEAPAGAEARLLATDAWAVREQLDLAVNANFFARLPGEVPLLGWTEGEWVDLVGVSVADGAVVSPPRTRADGTGVDPALLLREQGRGPGGGAPSGPGDRIDSGRQPPDGGLGAEALRSRRSPQGTGDGLRPAPEPDNGHCPCAASVGFPAAADLAGVSEAVAGYGPNQRLAGSRLVEAGVNRGATARVQWDKRHPRTAAGVSRDGTTLVLVVLDGRREGWSVGATLPELASVVIAAGAWDAVALDGGGSSALWLRDEKDASGRVRNRPSDGRVRAVGNALGVRVSRGAP